MSKKLIILSGGPGREREVSLSSGRNIVDLLEKESIECELVTINKDLTWVVKGMQMSEAEGISFLAAQKCLVFQVVHGTYGEDGTLVALLESAGVQCIGSSSSTLLLSIDKHKTEQLLRENSISSTKSLCVTDTSQLLGKSLHFPLIIKPNNEGSSIALTKAHSEEELFNVLNETLPLYKAMLVQEYVSGREFTCGVVEMKGHTVALPPTEVILTRGDTFDYEAKYTPGGCREVTPAEIDEKLTQKIKDVAMAVHTVCGCRDISRTDMIMKANGELVVLEINTVPGMTKTSFIPAQLEASGYSVVDFLKGMLEKYQ